MELVTRDLTPSRFAILSRTGYLFVLSVSDWCARVCAFTFFTTITSLSNLDALYTSNCGHGLAAISISRKHRSIQECYLRLSGVKGAM